GPPASLLFPSTTLFRSGLRLAGGVVPVLDDVGRDPQARGGEACVVPGGEPVVGGERRGEVVAQGRGDGRRHLLEPAQGGCAALRSEEHTSELQSRENLV